MNIKLKLKPELVSLLPPFAFSRSTCLKAGGWWMVKCSSGTMALEYSSTGNRMSQEYCHDAPARLLEATGTLLGG